MARIGKIEVPIVDKPMPPRKLRHRVENVRLEIGPATLDVLVELLSGKLKELGAQDVCSAEFADAFGMLKYLKSKRK